MVYYGCIWLQYIYILFTWIYVQCGHRRIYIIIYSIYTVYIYGIYIRGDNETSDIAIYIILCIMYIMVHCFPRWRYLVLLKIYLLLLFIIRGIRMRILNDVDVPFSILCIVVHRQVVFYWLLELEFQWTSRVTIFILADRWRLYALRFYSVLSLAPLLLFWYCYISLLLS